MARELKVFGRCSQQLLWCCRLVLNTCSAPTVAPDSAPPLSISSSTKALAWPTAMGGRTRSLPTRAWRVSDKTVRRWYADPLHFPLTPTVGGTLVATMYVAPPPAAVQAVAPRVHSDYAQDDRLTLLKEVLKDEGQLIIARKIGQGRVGDVFLAQWGGNDVSSE